MWKKVKRILLSIVNWIQTNVFIAIIQFYTDKIIRSERVGNGIHQKVIVGNDQEMGRSESNSHSKNGDGEKLN